MSEQPVKAIWVLKRPPDVTVADFTAALELAEPLARAIPGVRRYVRSLTLPSGYRRKEPIYDAVDELWFEDETAARAALAAPEFALAQQGYGDRADSGLFLVHDHVAKEGPIPPDGVKSFEFVTRRSDLSVEQFQRYWREVHGPIAVHIEVIRHYVQSHTLQSEYADGRTPLWEGSAITWFDDLQAMRVSGASAELAATRADEAAFWVRR